MSKNYNNVEVSNNSQVCETSMSFIATAHKMEVTNILKLPTIKLINQFQFNLATYKLRSA